MHSKIMKIFREALLAKVETKDNKITNIYIAGEERAAGRIENLLESEILLRKAGFSQRNAKKFRKEIRRNFFRFLDEIIDSSRWQDRWYFAWKLIRGSKAKG